MDGEDRTQVVLSGKVLGVLPASPKTPCTKDSAMVRTGLALSLFAFCSLAGTATAQVLLGGFPVTAHPGTQLGIVTNTPTRGGSVTMNSQTSSTRFSVSWPGGTGGVCDIVPVSLSGTSQPFRAHAHFSDGTTEIARMTTIDSGSPADPATTTCDVHGAMEIRYRCLSSDGTVLCEGVHSGSSISMHDFSPPDASASSSLGGGKVNVQDISFTKRCRSVGTVVIDTSSGPVSCDNVASVQFIRIVCITSPCPGDGLGITRMNVIADSSVIEVSEVCSVRSMCDSSSSTCDSTSSLHTFATGGAELVAVSGTTCCEDCDDRDDRMYRLSPPVGAVPGESSLVTEFGPQGSQPVHGVSFKKEFKGHVTLLKRTASSGASQRCLVQEDALSGATTFTYDYTEQGNPDLEITAFDVHGAPVGTAIIAGTGTITMNPEILCPPPAYPTFAYVGPFKVFTGCAGGYELVIPSSSGTAPTVMTGVHSIRVSPVFGQDACDDVAKVSFSDLSVTADTGDDVIVGDYCVIAPPTGPVCDSIDFNNDGLFPDDADLLEFLSVLAGSECSTGACNDIDFNNDGLFPDDSDLISFLTVLAGGDCS
jgi:hypothetical protein